MKKEMRVKDLNPEVQAILRDLIKKSGMRPIQISEASLKDIHELIDWTKATDAERLAYCEVRYPNNTECLFGEAKRKDSVLWPLKIKDSWIADKKNNALYNPDSGKFAEIIEEVDQLREIVRGEKQPFNLSDTGAFSSEPVEFKEGEMVEAWNVDSHYHKVIWSGGKNKDGAFICYLKGTTGGSVCHLRVYENIRKIDPDKELKAIAKEIFKKHYDLKTANKCDEAILSHMEYAINAMVEAMKKVQSKK